MPFTEEVRVKCQELVTKDGSEGKTRNGCSFIPIEIDTVLSFSHIAAMCRSQLFFFVFQMSGDVRQNSHCNALIATLIVFAVGKPA